MRPQGATAHLVPSVPRLTTSQLSFSVSVAIPQGKAFPLTSLVAFGALPGDIRDKTLLVIARLNTKSAPPPHHRVPYRYPGTRRSIHYKPNGILNRKLLHHISLLGWLNRPHTLPRNARLGHTVQAGAHLRNAPIKSSCRFDPNDLLAEICRNLARRMRRIPLPIRRYRGLQLPRHTFCTPIQQRFFAEPNNAARYADAGSVSGVGAYQVSRYLRVDGTLLQSLLRFRGLICRSR